MLQFADKAIAYLNNLDFWDQKEHSVSQGHCVTFPNRECSSTMGEFVILHDLLGMGGFPIEAAFPPMVSAIQHRGTTKIADQTLCACTILGQDPVDLLQAPGKGDELQDQRMQIFLQMLGSFPPNLIFNKCPRLRSEGFRWAPRSILGIPKGGFLRSVCGRF